MTAPLRVNRCDCSRFLYASTSRVHTLQTHEMYKPFKPPFRRSVPSAPRPALDIDLTIPESDDETDLPSKQPPYKKRRLIHIVEDSPPPAKAPTSSAVNAPRKPLLVVKNASEPKRTTDDPGKGLEGYYMVLW